MNIRLSGDGNQVDNAVAALEKLPWLRITTVSRPYANRRDPEQMRIYLNAEVNADAAVDAVIGPVPAGSLDVQIIDGRREVWLVICGVGGYVCAEPDPGRPDDFCGIPVETEPCPIHHPDNRDA